MFPCSTDDLAAAWRYARRDAADNFVFDVIDHEDVSRNLPRLLRRLELAIKGGSYTPSPLLSVDVPKKPYSVRPGAVVALPDLIVLYALVRKVAAALDAQLSPAVFSYRWLPEKKNGFRSQADDADEDEHESDEALPATMLAPYPPFGEVSPAGWFRGWVDYHEHVKDAADRHEFCAVGDVTAYFENVAVDDLFDRIEHLLGPEHAEAASALRQFYEFWAWQPAGVTARGDVLPQGNDISLFLANFFLRDFDRKMDELTKGQRGRYLRYVDDFCVFADSREEGHRALLACDQVLRGLSLSLNPEKTRVSTTAELFEAEVEDWLERVSPANPDAAAHAAEFVNTHYEVGTPQQWDRPYLRALTTLQRAGDDAAVPKALETFLADPSYKLLVKNFDYLSRFASGNDYAEALLVRLTKDAFTFPFHKHYLYRLGAYGREESLPLRDAALREARSDAEWHVRVAALFCLNSFALTTPELREIEKLAERESHPAVVRAALVALRQRPSDELTSARDQILFSTAPGQETLREYFYRVVTDEELARQLLAEIEETDVSSPAFVRRLHQLDLLKNNAAVRADLADLASRKLAESRPEWQRSIRRLFEIRELALEAARRHTETLKTVKARDHLEVVLRGSREAIIITDEKSAIQTWNDAASDLLGYYAEETLGRPLVAFVGADNGYAAGKDLLAAVVEAGGSLTEEALPLRRRNGTRLTAAATYAVITGPTGEPAGLSVLLRDVSAEIRAAEAEQFQTGAEKLLLNTSARFVAPDDLDAAVEATLKETAALVGAGRAYLYRLADDGKSLRVTRQWTRPGLTPLEVGTHAVELNRVALFKYQLLGRHAVVTSDAEALPPAERETLEKRGARASLGVPFFIGGELAGMVGCDDTSRYRAWEPEEINLLFSVTAIISKAVSRREAEETLAESEAKFRTFTESAPVAIMIYQDYKCVYANAEAARTTGYSHEELARMEFRDFVQPEHKYIPIEGGKALERGEIPILKRELKIATRDGDEKWLDGRMGIIDYGGRKAALISAMDITPRKRAEEALRESERDKTTILESMAELVTFMNRDLEIVWANKAAAEWAGLTPQEMRGRLCYDVWFGRDEPCEHCHAALALGTGEAQELETVYHDGSIWNVRCNPVRDEKGETLGVVEVSLDITRRKRAETELKASHAFLDNVLNAMYEGLAVVDPDRKIREVNACFADWAGLPREDILGRYCYDATRHAGGACCTAEYPCPLDEVFEKGKASTAKHLHVNAAGEEYVVEVSAFPVRNTEGEVTAAVRVSRDVTEQERAERTLVRRAEDLAAINGLAVELAAAADTTDIYRIAAERLREITGALGVVVTGYDPGERVLRIKHVAAESGIIARAERVLRTAINDIRPPVDEATRAEMLAGPVKTFTSISDLVMQDIPKRLGSALVKVLGIGDISAGALRYGDELFGTVAALMPRGRAAPRNVVLENFANVVSASLLRKSAEEALQRRSEEITAVNELAIELAAAATTEEMFAIICGKLKDATGAIAAVTATYNKDKDELALNHVVSDKKSLKKAHKILGVDVLRLSFPVEKNRPEDKASERVIIFETPPEPFYKFIPKKVWPALAKGLAFGPVYALLLRDAGTLLGTAAAVMPKNSPPLSVDVLEAYAHVAAAALHRKTTEEGSRLTEERFRLLADTVDAGFGIKDRDNVIAYVNDRFCDISGYSREELIGRPVAAFLGKTGAKKARGRAPKNGEERGGYREAVWIGKDGRRIPTTVSPDILANGDGGYVGTFATSGDVDVSGDNGDSLLERRLEEIAAANTLALELNSAGSVEGIYQVVCNGLRRLTGAMVAVFTRYDEVTNKISVQHIASRHGVLGKAAKVLGVKPRYLEFPLSSERAQYFISEKVSKTDGIPAYLYDTIPKAVARTLEDTFSLGEIYVVTLRSAGGFMGVLGAVMRKGDPSPAVETLEAIGNFAAATLQHRLARDMVRESEDKFRALAEKSLQGILIAGHDRVAFANPRLGEITGYEPGELVGLTPAEIIRLLIHPLDRDLVSKNFNKRLSDNSGPPRYKFRIFRKCGAEATVEMRATRINLGGRPAVQAVFTDARGPNGDDV